MRQTILYAIISRPTERHSNRTEKAEEEMTQYKKQAQLYYREYKGQDPNVSEGINMTNFAAFCLEKNGWKKYPDEKPENIGEYLVIINDGDDYKPSLLRKINDNHVWSRAVIAFMPIPEYNP